MIKIYFDNVLIDEDKYSSLSNDFELFDTSFRLGITASNKFKMSIGKEAITTQPNEIKIYDNSTLIATLVVDNIEEDDYTYTYTLTDKMVNLEFYYNASLIFVNGHATLLDIALDICSKAGITLATTNFRGYDKDISWYDNTRTAREYIGYIAELNGGYAQIGTDGRLYFLKQKTNSAKTIGIDDCKDFKIGERKEITRVVYELGTLKYEYGDETGNTLYLNSDNVFITESSEVESIYNEIQGFEFYNFTTTNCPIDFNIRAGQIITFTDGENDYPTIVGYELSYYGDWYGGYSLDVESTKQEETQIVSTDKKIKNLTVIVNREANAITQVIEEVGEQNNKISQITQTVDEINSKLEDIADITVSGESIYASLSLDDINQSEPIELKVHPIITNISYLYPRSNLYPSNTLYMTNRKIRFIRTYTENGQTLTQNIDYILPDNLLYYDADNYDEFYLNYDSQTCQVIKKCKYNADGTVGLLQSTVTTNYPYPQILLDYGDYEIKILGYSTGYISARLMAANIYTTQFATKAELNSEISQTTTDINLSVDSKLSNYSTTTEMNAAINVKANEINSVVSTKVGNDEVISKINQSSEAVTINANKISLSGKQINLTSDNVSIQSNYFNVDNTGKVVINSSTNAYTGAELKLVGDSVTNYLYSSAMAIRKNNSDRGIAAMEVLNDGTASLYINSVSGGSINIVAGQGISVLQGDISTSGDINATGTVTAQDFIRTSLEEKKKNFEKFDNALDIIKNTDIYKYQYKNKDDNTKKDIGLVIGKNFKYSEELTNDNNTAVNMSNVIFVCVKAIQEQQEEIEELKEKIKKLENKEE